MIDSCKIHGGYTPSPKEIMSMLSVMYKEQKEDQRHQYSSDTSTVSNLSGSEQRA